MGVYSAVRPLLFRNDAEAMHERVMRAAEVASASRALCRAVHAFRGRTSSRLATTVAGLRFPNPIGLAAGFDKSGRGVPFLASLGFGFVEIGSVSAQPSAGNPRPRLFRLPEERAIIVNYGLPNEGAERVAVRLADARWTVPLGINIVSTNRGSGAPQDSEHAVIADYVDAADRLRHHADYFALNLSCPNTPEGRGFFSAPGRLEHLLARIAELSLAQPVFLKVAPFASVRDLEAFLAVAGMSPVVAGYSVNLPPGKPAPLRAPPHVLASMPGAVAGKPAAALADASIRELYRSIDRTRQCVIGSGGVFTAEDAYRKVRLGAALVQLLTALVYDGPGAPARIVSGLDRLLARDGHASMSSAVGIDAA